MLWVAEKLQQETERANAHRLEAKTGHTEAAALHQEAIHGEEALKEELQAHAAIVAQTRESRDGMQLK